MAITLANRGLHTLINSAISGGTDLRTLVIKGAVPSAATIRDLNTVADLLAESGVQEAAATNYARQDLAGVTVTEDDTGDNVTITATAPTIADVGAGETWLAVAHYVEGASDAARLLIGVDEPASPQVTNGSGITLPQLSITVAQG